MRKVSKQTLLSCDLVDDIEPLLAWIAGFSVVLTFINTSLDPVLLRLGATFIVLALSGHVSPSDVCKASLMQHALS